jgi:pimeloyl-ACP methyl ester carboxylesterase
MVFLSSLRRRPDAAIDPVPFPWSLPLRFTTPVTLRLAVKLVRSIVMVFVAFALQGNATGRAEPSPAAFAETPCDLLNVSPAIRPRLRCGTVSVPRDYTSPAGGRFDLAVVVVKSPQQPALPDPVVYISGGPGSPLTIYADYQARHPYAPGRDLILVDQRGIGRSQPGICPDLNDKLLQADLAFAAEPTEQARATGRARYLSCREQAIAQGLDLNDFGTSVTVADFEQVRQALGVARWNVFGESYGTTVAMTLLAQHPDTVRSAVLDSLYPPDPIMPLFSSRVAEARDAFFTSCERNAACTAEFPDLARVYRQTLARLDHTPLAMAVPPPMQRPNNQVQLTASLFDGIVAQLIYYPTFYPGLPRLISAVHDGDTSELATAAASLLAAAEDLNRAARASVECRDRPHYRRPLADGANASDQALLYGICDDWSALGPSPLLPIGTDVPTLVLAGQFDPVAGPSLSRHVTELIGRHAEWIEFPLIGHNVRHFSACGARIVAAFIDHPAQSPDASCAANPASIRFLPKHRTP